MGGTWQLRRAVATGALRDDSARMAPLDISRPFVLLDDASVGGGAGRLYRDPLETIVATESDQIGPAMKRLRGAVRDGRHVAGYLSYEAGLALEPRFGEVPASGDGPPLLWFGVFSACEPVPHDLLPDPAGAWAGTPQPRISEEDYVGAVERTLGLIAAGDIYQANISFRADVPFAGSPLALYARMRGAGGGGWGGVVHDGRNWLLSCSPELFFELKDGRLRARPMKGTLTADATDEALRDDPKQRAENLMIVDLIRNDLSRVAVPGSVTVPSLFDIERYPTVLTMTSTITADLASGKDAVDVIEALFPCGSITGAPKIRAMEIISELEPDRRGPYTGSIGSISPEGDAAFNVVIRTLMIEPDGNKAVIGLGSGIVADSDPHAEWRECLAKGAFVTAEEQPFDLIETMRFDADEGLCDLERHIARMKASATALDFEFDRHALRNDLQAATFRVRETSRVRVRLSKSGASAIEVRPMPVTPEVAEVAVAPMPVPREDFRLMHKTSDRDFYDDARADSKAFELAFFDADGFVTEGSFTNIFVEQGGRLVTPPLSRGLLPGVLRERLIEEGRAVESDVRPADLQFGFFIGNALRGLIPARLVAGAKAPGL
jgi:para-aminobenzoate synthetase / 4-amino-4-deoxychorismate lyase